SGISGLVVGPIGSKRIPLKRTTASSIERPYCSAIEKARQNAWHIPDMVDPSLAILMNSSPRDPSGCSPIVRYPSWFPMQNLGGIDDRVSGRIRRLGSQPLTSKSDCEDIEASIAVATPFAQDNPLPWP